MYNFVIGAHSYVRWAALLALLAVLVRSTYGWLAGKEQLAADQKLVRAAINVVGIEFILGLLLYFVWSPFTLETFSNFQLYSQNSQYRFFTLDHAIAMFVAVALFNIGSSMAKKGATDTARFRRQALFTLVVLLIIAGSIPWPGMSAGRPLFR